MANNNNNNFLKWAKYDVVCKMNSVTFLED